MSASGHYRTLKILLALGLAGLGGACSTMQTLIPGTNSSRTRLGVETHSGTTRESDKLVTLPLSAADLDCPIVEVEDGAAAVRVGGPANAEVRYQFDIGDTARECQPQGSNFALKVGISGHLLIGPAGSPGTYSAVLKVLVRREVGPADGVREVLQGRSQYRRARLRRLSRSSPTRFCCR